MSKFLICGGAGMIGSTLVKRLLREKNEVVIIDDLSTGSLKNLPKEFFPLAVIGRITDIKFVSGLDGIFHLGIPCASPLYRENHRLVGKALTEFIEVMEYAKINKVKTIFASTSSIYNGNISPYHEDMTIYPKDFYAEVRFTMERLAKVYHDFYKVKTIALRPFSVFGPNEHSKGIYANLVSQIFWAKKNKESIDIYNKGEGLRDFIHVDDVVNAFMMAMASDIDFDVFNVGTGKAHTINEVIQAIGMTDIKYTNPPGVENFKSPDTLADVSKSYALLGFKAKIDVLEYLKNQKENL